MRNKISAANAGCDHGGRSNAVLSTGIQLGKTVEISRTYEVMMDARKRFMRWKCERARSRGQWTDFTGAELVDARLLRLVDVITLSRGPICL